MTLEQICVSKEWAEKLKEAGFPQKDSYFYWSTVNKPNIVLKDKYQHPISQALTINPHWLDEIIAAPTASEILEKLPSFIVLDTNKTWLSCSKNIFNLFEVGYATNGGFINGHMEEKSLVDALARMYCYLVSEKLTPSGIEAVHSILVNLLTI